MNGIPPSALREEAEGILEATKPEVLSKVAI
jgi:hypothetical protein